jgi:SPP1 gp7 family putative phage head morphogenesis protein
MPPTNDDIRDVLLAHQVQLLRFGKGLSKRIVSLLNKIEPELTRRLKKRLDRIAAQGWDPGPDTTKRMIKTARLIRAIQLPTWEAINSLVRTELVGLALGESVFVAGVIVDNLPVKFAPALPSVRELRGIVFARPFQNRILRDWLGTFQLNDRRRMMDQIRQGLVFSETPTQISRRIWGTQALGGTDGVRQITRRGAQTLTQTATSAISNAVRQELYKANRRVIPREQYVATLDSRTTPICSSLDGDVFPVGDGPIPPLHMNCRSIRVPVIDGRKLGSRPATPFTEKDLRGLKGPQRRRRVEQLTGKVPADTTYQQWLGNQRAGFQDDVLGPTRGRLFRSGELDLKGFVDNSGDQFTLRQLYEQDPTRFQRANLPAPRRPTAAVPEL